MHHGDRSHRWRTESNWARNGMWGVRAVISVSDRPELRISATSQKFRGWAASLFGPNSRVLRGVRLHRTRGLDFRKELIEFICDFTDLLLCGASTRNHHDVHVPRELLARSPKPLPNGSLDAIAHDRIADAPAHTQAKASIRGVFVAAAW